MADKTIRISELPSSGSNTAGLYTIGVNASNESVKVPLGDILASAHGEVMFADLDKLCTADDMLQGKPACYTVLDTLVSTKGTVTLKVGVLWVYSDNLRHVVMQVLNTNFVLDDDGTFTGKVHNHDVHEYSRTYAYSTAAGTLHTWSKWQEVGGKGIVDRITNVALAKQNKLTAGDKATRIDDDNLATKQIYKGTLISTIDVVPTLPEGAYCYNTATKKLYVGAQHGNAMVTDTVDTPDDFLFVDTATGATYRCDGTTLNNIANIKTINGQSLLGGGNIQLTGEDMLLEHGAGLTINEAVNSNTEELQNKLDKASVVQTTGQATDKVMSQAAVTDYVPDYCATLHSYTPNEAWNASAFNVSNLARTRNTYSTAAKPYVFVRSTAASSSYIPNTVAFVVSTVAISLDEHIDNIIKAVTDGMVLYNINGNWHLVVKRSDSQVLDHQFATRLASGFNWAVLLDYRASKLTFKATNNAGSAVLEESVDLSSLDIDFGDVYYLAGLGTNGIVPDVIFCYNDLYVTIDSYSDPLTCSNYKIAGPSSVPVMKDANLTDGLNTTAMDAIYTTHSYDSDTGAYTGSLSSDSYTTKSVLQVKDAIAKFNSGDTVWRVTLKVTGSMTIKAGSSYINNWIIKDLTAGTEEMVSSVAADHVLTDGHEYEFIYKAVWYSGNWFFAKGDFTAVWSGLQWLSILHTDLTPSNYDGKMIKGNIDFYYDNPSGVTTVPQVIVGTSNPWNVVGTQRVDTSGNIYYKVKSGTSLIEKKINNT